MIHYSRFFNRSELIGFVCAGRPLLVILPLSWMFPPQSGRANT